MKTKALHEQITAMEQLIKQMKGKTDFQSSVTQLKQSIDQLIRDITVKIVETEKEKRLNFPFD